MLQHRPWTATVLRNNNKYEQFLPLLDGIERKFVPGYPYIIDLGGKFTLHVDREARNPNKCCFMSVCYVTVKYVSTLQFITDYTHHCRLQQAGMHTSLIYCLPNINDASIYCIVDCDDYIMSRQKRTKLTTID